jgi:glycine cleavage system regulatory protein
MRSFVLSVIGDDRPGLVSALADALASHGGNWERSQLARLAGKFAGIVVVAVSTEDADALIGAVTSLDGLLEVAVHDATDADDDAGEDWSPLTIGVLGNDRAGIIQEVSKVLGAAGVTIDNMTAGTREAPMAGGLLFEAQLDVRVPPATDLLAVRSELEGLASELFVDIDMSAIDRS